MRPRSFIITGIRYQLKMKKYYFHLTWASYDFGRFLWQTLHVGKLSNSNSQAKPSLDIRCLFALHLLWGILASVTVLQTYLCVLLT